MCGACVCVCLCTDSQPFDAPVRHIRLCRGPQECFSYLSRVLVRLVLFLLISLSRIRRSLPACRKPEMCDAWLLLTRHGPDGARAHTGYAYGSMARACNPEGRSNPTPRALLLQPPEERRNARRRSDALGSRTYAHAESAHEVTRPQVFNPSLICCCCCAYAGRESQKAANRSMSRSTTLTTTTVCEK